MPLYIPADYYEASFHHSHNAMQHVSVCTLGLQYTGTDFATDAGAVFDGWGGNVVTPMSNQFTFILGRMRDAGGTLYETSRSAAGGDGAEATPPNTTFLLKKVTAVSGRRNRGRMYLPGVCEPDVNSIGAISSAKLGSVNEAISLFLAYCETNHFIPVILHNGTLADPTPAPTPMTGMFCEDVCATQRRRLRP